jgi:hypothetical protein
MKKIRSLTNTRSTMHRIFFSLGFAVALIAGLLAMHTLNAGGTHIESAPTATAFDHGQKAVALDGAAVDSGYCVNDCGAPRPMPDHLMLLMVCALALLAVVLVVVAPALLVCPSTSLSLAMLVRNAGRALPAPRPPSLLVLSISRT